MSESFADLDLPTLGVIGLCLVLGFFIVWTFLSARSDDKSTDHRKKLVSDEDDQNMNRPGD